MNGAHLTDLFRSRLNFGIIVIKFDTISRRGIMNAYSAKSWDQVRQEYPDRWVIIQAMRSHSKSNKRIIDEIDVVSTFNDSEKAMREYLRLHREDRSKELYVVHTNKVALDITEQRWLGIRPA